MDDGALEEITNYKSSLADLNCNSKPLINVLTILAEENIKYAPQIVKTITEHAISVSSDSKLPCLYLIDSIVKNVRKQYLNLFGQSIVDIFASVFEKVDEGTRMLLYKLRQTWNEIFSNKVLYAMDMKVKEMDPAWPVTAQPPPQSIHVNPKFLGSTAAQNIPEHASIRAHQEELKLKAQQNEVLKQLFVKQEQLRLIEQKKMELASKQFLRSNLQSIVTPVGTPTVTVPQNVSSDPRTAAKVMPKLNQRDPRLQKVLISTVLKKNLTQTKLKDKPVSPPASKIVVPSVIASVPPPQCPAEVPKLNKTVTTLPVAKDTSTEVLHAMRNETHRDKLDKKRPLEKASLKRDESPNKHKKRKVEESPKKDSKLSPKKSLKEKGSKKDSPKKVNKKNDSSHSKQSLKKSDKDERKSKKDSEASDSKLKHTDSPKDKKVDASGELKSSKVQESKSRRENKAEGKENLDQPADKKYKENKEGQKNRIDETDSLFGREDQDYRKLVKNDEVDTGKGWAMYKAAHPEEFKIPKKQPMQNSFIKNQNSFEDDNLKHGAFTFMLDNKLRVIHYVDDRAIAMMDNNEPRELLFRGEPTEVFISGLKPITLRFDGRPIEFLLDGRAHIMKFGFPSRELYIDGFPYKGKFGGKPFEVVLHNKVYLVALGLPAPQVQVSRYPAHGLYRRFLLRSRRHREFLPVAPAIKREQIPAKEMVAEYPEALPYDVDMRAEPMQRPAEPRDMDWRQIGAERNDRIDGREDYDYRGSGPVPFNKPGPVDRDQWDQRDRDSRQIPHPKWRKYPPFRDIERNYSPHGTPPQEDWDQPRPPPPPPYKEEDRNFDVPSRPWLPRDFNQGGPNHNAGLEPPNPYSQRLSPQHFDSHSNFPDRGPAKNYPDSRGPANYPLPIRPPSRPTLLPHPPRPEVNTTQFPMHSTLPRPPMPPWVNDQIAPPVRPSILPPPPRPPIHMQMPPDTFRPSAPVEPFVANPMAPTINRDALPAPPQPPILTEPVAMDSSYASVPEVPKLDITSLFAKLLAAGIITKSEDSKPESESKVTESKKDNEEKKETEKEEEECDLNDEVVPSIKLKLECLKVRYAGVTSALYRGSQCASCGMRFKEIQGERYSRHLDWHFRVNRREKDGIKKAFSRKWYYEIEDWIQFEEFEEFEDRARSFFDLQADEQFQMETDVEVPSVPVSGQETESCVVCEEPFQLFWVEDEEEWHLRNAVRHDEQAYHPSCYEDYKKSLEAPLVKDEPADEQPKEEEPLDKEIKIEPVDEELKEEPMDVDVTIPLVEIKTEPQSEKDTFDYSEITKEVEDVIQMITESVVKQEEERIIEEATIKVEPEDDIMQGKPGEEEIIGVITDENDAETESKPTDESEKVVFQSGGIIMKVRAESLKPASPLTDSQVPKVATEAKDTTEESDEEEFRPPTPDPRFKVMPPVNRGTELSGLCIIM